MESQTVKQGNGMLENVQKYTAELIASGVGFLISISTEATGMIGLFLMADTTEISLSYEFYKLIIACITAIVSGGLMHMVKKKLDRFDEKKSQKPKPRKRPL